MYTILFTSYTQLEDKSLRLANNWTITQPDDKGLLELLAAFKLPNDFKYLSKGTMSEILEGEMQDNDRICHVRIIRF